MDPNPLTIADALKVLQADIQGENRLIASRVTWYVTSQAFLLTAYAQSWTYKFEWPYFFHELLPLAGIALSFLTFAFVYAATWAQEVYLREQVTLVAAVKARMNLSPPESLALLSYERTMVANRTSRSGRVLGSRVHAVVRITPFFLPAGFTLLWLYAYFFAPHVGP